MTTTNLTTTTTRPAIWDDIPQMLALNTEAMMDQWGQPFWMIEDLEAEFSNPGFDASEQTRLWFDEANVLVAMAMVYTYGTPPVKPRFDLYIRPTYPHYQAIGMEAFAWAEAVARHRVFPLCPPDVKIYFSTLMLADYAPNVELYTANGMYKLRQSWVMEIDLQDDMPEPELEEGFTIRTIRYPEESRALFHITDDAFVDHFGHVPDPEGKNYETWAHHRFEHKTFDPTMWFVIEYQGEYAGFAWTHLGMPEDPKLGWVDILGVLPKFRKRGLGIALLRHAFRVFYARGMHKAGLGVDSESLTGATRLYERAGMHLSSKWDTYTKVLRDGVDLMRS